VVTAYQPAASLEPTTMLGFQAKAKMWLHWYRDGDDDLDEDPIAVEIIKGLASAKLAA
jgi:hypothetical protein